jgi:hypothetical protein
MLTGEAKKIYQREYMRKRRVVKPLDPLVVLDQTLEQLHDYSCRLEKVNDTISEVAETMKKKRKVIEPADEPKKETTLILETKICPACGGKGYREFESGLIRLPCRECQK